MTNLPKMKPERAVVYWNQKCVDAVRSAAVAAWHCGTALAQVKEIKAHGEFGPWLAKIGISTSGAARYMTLAREYQISQLGKFDTPHQALLALSEGENNMDYKKIGDTLDEAMKVIQEYMKYNPMDEKIAGIILCNGPDMDKDEVRHRRQHTTPMDDLRAWLKMARLCVTHINTKAA